MVKHYWSHHIRLVTLLTVNSQLLMFLPVCEGRLPIGGNPCNCSPQWTPAGVEHPALQVRVRDQWPTAADIIINYNLSTRFY